VRLLLLLLVSHVAGIVYADRGGGGPPGFALAGLAAIAAAGVLAARSGPRSAGAGGRRFAVSPAHGRALALCAAGALSFASGQRGLARELDRARTGAEQAEALDPALDPNPDSNRDSGRGRLVDARVHARRPTGFGEEVELRSVRARPGEGAVPERLLLALPAERPTEGLTARSPDRARSDRLLWPGAEVRLALHVLPLRPSRNPGTPDRERALARQGIGARARLVKPDWVVERAPNGDARASLASRLAGLRRDLGERVRARLAERGDGAALVRALALGDRRDLADTTRRSFRALGLAHLLSVSGLHIAFVAMPAAWLVGRARSAWRPRARPILGFALPIAAGCGAAIAYAWLTGASVPALRASLLLAAFGLARALGLTLSPAPALAAIALVLVAGDPANLFDAGALLSFTACAALIAAGVWGTAPGAAEAPGPVPRLRAWLLDPVRASLAVSLALLPWVELSGMPRATVSPLVNALAIPWTGFVVMPCALAASALACVLPAGSGDDLLALLLWPAACLEARAAELAAALPPIWTGEDRAGWLPWLPALASIALALARLRRGDVATAGAVWLLLATAGLAPIRERAFVDLRPRVVFFDVGQADAALVETRRANWLIDTGSGPDDGSGGAALVRALRALGVDALDVLAITHGDLDHRGGASRILRSMPVGELWIPALSAPDPALEALAEQARARRIPVRRVAAGDRRVDAGTGDDALAVEVLWPPAPGLVPPPARGRARNEASLVLRFALAGRRALFMADVGAEVEASLLRRESALAADLLKVAHHGSRQGSGAGFLEAVGAGIAIVSAPCGGGRGLPSAAALERLGKAGAEVAWTGRDGAVGVVGWTGARGAPLEVRQWGARRSCEAKARGRP